MGKSVHAGGWRGGALRIGLAVLLVGMVGGCRAKGGGAGGAADAGPGAFAVVATPSAADVPKGPVQGMANGKPFVVKGIWFEPTGDHWELKLSESELEGAPSSLVLTKKGAQEMSLLLPQDLPSRVGTPIQKPLGQGNGSFNILDHGTITGWASVTSYYVEITKWDAKPYDPKGPRIQVGKASGRVYAGQKSVTDGSILPSGAAGEFHDVLVRYWDKPQWMK